jgi:large subunit ribosomal protein L10
VPLPTQTKIDRVNELKEKLERSSIVVAANYTSIPAAEMTELRRRVRAAGVELLVVKNTLMSLAADAAHRPQVKQIVQGPTAIALGYDDPVVTAKTLQDYIRATRSALAIRGAVLSDGPALAPSDVERLAALPSRTQLIASLLAQMQAPLYRLLAVLNGPLQKFDGLLQARIRQLESQAADS